MVSLATINENLRIRNPARRKSQDGLPSLRREAIPAEGQSLRGLAAHALRRNNIRTAWRVLKDVGAPARNRALLSEHSNVNAARLSAVMKVDEDIVRARMYPLIRKGERSFFGLPVPHTGIETRERRFAPTFLKNNRHHLAAWELRLLPFCPVTWDILVNQCPCRPGKVTTQGWTRTGSYPDQCDECSRPLSRIQTDKIPAQYHEPLELVTRLVVDVTHGRDGWRECLPANLADVDAADLFRVLHALADNLHVRECPDLGFNPDPFFDGGNQQAARAIARLADACKILIGWPYAIENTRFDLAEDSALLVKLQKDYCALGVVRESERSGIGKATIPLGRSRSDGGSTIGIREATAVARLSVDTLEAIWTAGLVTRYVRPHGGRMLSAFDAKELEAIAEEWRKRLELGSVAYRLGIARYGLEDLIDQRIISAQAVTAAGLVHALLEHDVAKFEAELVAAADVGMTNGVSIEQAMRNVSGRMKPWGSLISALLNGTVQYGVLAGDGPIIERVVLDENFDTTTLPTLDSDHGSHRLHSPARLCQTDALEILNCSASSLSILDGLSSKGKNPRFFDRSCVLDLAARVVATAEVAEHLGVHPARVARIMRSANIHEIVRGGWPREPTQRFVGHVRRLKAAQLCLSLNEGDGKPRSRDDHIVP